MLSQPLSSPPDLARLRRKDGRPVRWAAAPAPVPYDEAVAFMEDRVAAIHAGEAEEMIWLLEHPPLYTAGVSAKSDDLIDARFPVFQTGRGGQYTYHGPGQRVAYVMLDLNRRGRDVRDGRVGVWVERRFVGDDGAPQSREDKIAAIGVKVRRWVSFHGISLNVEPDLDHFGGIVPCGIREHGVTSLADLGLLATMDDADAALKTAFEQIFGPVSSGGA